MSKISKVKKLYKYEKFIQTINEDLLSELSPKISDKNKEIKEDLMNLIHKTIDSEDQEIFMKKIEDVIRNPKEPLIEGLMQDADIYEFYLKYRNELDEILSEKDFFNKLQDFQKENNSISLYDFIVKGTMEAVKILLQEIKSELLGEESNQQTEQI